MGEDKPAVFRHEFAVPAEAVDGNGHVNNVVYVQWMQDVAIRHADASGSTRLTDALGTTWVVRSHRVEYLKPAFSGDRIEARTWVETFRKVRCVRKYRFARAGDGAVLAEGETDWVHVDADFARPRTIPGEVIDSFRAPVGEESIPASRA